MKTVIKKTEQINSIAQDFENIELSEVFKEIPKAVQLILKHPQKKEFINIEIQLNAEKNNQFSGFFEVFEKKVVCCTSKDLKDDFTH